MCLEFYICIYVCVCVCHVCLCVCDVCASVCALISLINVADIAGDLTLIGTSKPSIIF